MADLGEKIKIGISSCLLGECVRYDGGHKHDRELLERLGSDFEFIPICPEVDCGMTIPREPLCLKGESEYPRIVTMRTCIDHSESMRLWGAERLAKLDEEELGGYIFKSKSPSCGLRDIEVCDNNGIIQSNKTGFWASMFTRHYSTIPVEDEKRLHSTKIMEDFLSQIMAYIQKR